MRIDIITIFPQQFESVFACSIIKRARQKGIVDIRLHNLRDYSTDKHRKVDDYPYGGGAGMVMMIEPIYNCIKNLQEQCRYDEIIFLTPDGELFEQKTANYLSTLNNIILLCGHYKGVDERVREHLITKEISIGNYVLSGGEIAAMVVTDAVVRLIPGVLGDETSALSDSFQDGLLAPPVYTRPSDFMGWKVPDVLKTGNAKEIEIWRYNQSVLRTGARRPDLLKDK
ncbi:MAG: tRNA (guanosine(37)-N1)-methyltransferase TrmD [Bacteroidetes bacterium]|nr:MAG: tRNA (guanosine(37)-N1)-methyltransferase TrmD [Bacteroidota bacterium]